MRKLHLPRYLRPVTWIRETSAFLLDFLFTFALGFLIYGTLGQFVLTPAFGGPEARARYDEIALASGFAYKDDKGAVKDYAIDRGKSDFDLYEQYKEVEARIWDYYTVKIPSSDVLEFLPSDNFKPSSNPGTIEYKKEVGKWAYEHVFGITEEPHPIWARAKEGFAYDSMPTPNPEILEKMQSPEKEKALAAYRDVFVAVCGTDGNDSTCLWSDAVYHFKSQPSISKAQDDLKFANYAGLYPAFIIPPLIFFLLVPLLMKNGVTFGKKICKIALIGTDGYAAKTMNILSHYGIIICYFYFFLIPYPLYSFMAFSLMMLIDYITLVLSRYHQSLHAIIAHTLSIDSDNSIWFTSRDAEMRYIKSHPSSLAARIYEEESGERLMKGEKPVDPVAFEREALGIFDASTLNQNPFLSKVDEKKEEKSEDSENS